MFGVLHLHLAFKPRHLVFMKLTPGRFYPVLTRFFHLQLLIALFAFLQYTQIKASYLISGFDDKPHALNQGWHNFLMAGRKTTSKTLARTKLSPKKPELAGQNVTL